MWAIDDGEKIRRDAPASPLTRGEGNPVWAPGQPIRLFAMKNETVAIQIVVAADDTPLDGVTVDLANLSNELAASKIENTPGANDPMKSVGRPIERFVEHFFTVTRASGGKDPKESQGWLPGSAPSAKWIGPVADALVPVEIAPSWSPYPMRVAAHENGIVWIDLTIARDRPAGLYKGTVAVKSGARSLADIPIELTVVDATLPDRPLATMIYYEEKHLERRIGALAPAEKQLWQLLHRHRLTALHTATSVEQIDRQRTALDGSAFTAANGYEGPGEGLGDGVLALGMYGDFGEPDAEKLRAVEALADHAAAKKLAGDIFVYAKDEDCKSPWGDAWRKLLAGSKSAAAKKLRVAWTCHEDPSSQPVDIPIMPGSYDAEKAARAKPGKETWIYNGQQPHTATFLTDAPAISPRVDGWIQALYRIPRWFYWESTFWYDGNKGGKGPIDPFVQPETFHNSDGDYSMGDGLLVYPGKQVDVFTTHSIGVDGVLPSIRLKNWRRGMEDAGYYQLAHAANAAKAEAVARALLPAVLADAKEGKPASWSESGEPYFEARRALLGLVTSNGAAEVPMPPSTGGCRNGCRSCSESPAPDDAGELLVFTAFALVLRRRR